MIFMEVIIKEIFCILLLSFIVSCWLIKFVVVDNIFYKKGWILIVEFRIVYIMLEYFEWLEKFELECFLLECNEG